MCPFRDLQRTTENRIREHFSYVMKIEAFKIKKKKFTRCEIPKVKLIIMAVMEQLENIY